MLRKKILQLLYGGFDESAYSSYAYEINKANLRALKQISLAGTILGLLLTIGSLLPLPFLNLNSGYIGMTAIFSTMYISSKTILSKHSNMILPCYYAFLLVIFIIACIMGTYMQPNSNAVTIIVFIVALPLFVLDKAYRLDLFMGIVCTGFCITTFYYKDGNLARMDCVNMIVFFVISNIISYQSIRTKMNEIISREILRSERDTDGLTGLWNRRFCVKKIIQYMNNTQNNAVMILLDIDNFKDINDMYGHDCGDEMLKLFSDKLSRAFRNTDIVSRIGGDEFLVFLPKCDCMSVVLDKLFRFLADTKKIKAEEYPILEIGASAGLSIYPEQGSGFLELYKNADCALYKAKENGKNCFFVYEEELINL